MGTLERMITTATSNVEGIISALIVALGLGLLAYGLFKLGMNIFGSQKNDPKWLYVFLAILVGGAFFVGGIGFLWTVTNATQDTLNELITP